MAATPSLPIIKGALPPSNSISAYRATEVMRRALKELCRKHGRVLDEVRAATGLAVSDALKAGLRSLQEKLRAGEKARPPYEIYRELDLGPGAMLSLHPRMCVLLCEAG